MCQVHFMKQTFLHFVKVDNLWLRISEIASCGPGVTESVCKEIQVVGAMVSSGKSDSQEGSVPSTERRPDLNIFWISG